MKKFCNLLGYIWAFVWAVPVIFCPAKYAWRCHGLRPASNWHCLCAKNVFVLQLLVLLNAL
ncbi:MAG: hypothetical protein ACI4TT_01915 [Christensenellales bacterium]